MQEFKCKECEGKFASEQALLQHSNSKHAGSALQKKEKKPLKINLKIVLAIVVALAVAGTAYYFYIALGLVPQGLGQVGSQHIHSDFKLYLEGKAVDLSQQKYQLRSQYVHAEDGDGDVVHVHATGATLGYFLGTIGFSVDKECISDGLGARHCNNDSLSLEVYVNGIRRDSPENYVFENLDKVLVSYGKNSQSDIEYELSTVTDKARLQPQEE